MAKLGPKWNKIGTKLGTKLGTKMEPNWTQIDTKLGTKMRPKWDQKGTKMGPRGTSMGSGTGPAPGAQKVSKVWNCRQKQLGAFRAGRVWYQILGPPKGLSKIPY